LEVRTAVQDALTPGNIFAGVDGINQVAIAFDIMNNMSSLEVELF
jgi:hypothetical protein